jgi:hypothetical protein
VAAADPAPEAPAAAEPAGAPPAAPAPAAAPAAAPAPAPAAAEEEEAAQPGQPAGAPKRKRTAAAQIGLSPEASMISGPSAPTANEAPVAEDWGFKFHGYFRGPMRLSFNKFGNQNQVRTPPVTPDLNYTVWTYTNNNPGPWAELLFQYGNNRAVMTAALASYNITSGGWRELQDQLGVDRAFLTLNYPDALGDLGKLTLNVGVFSNRYGAMGKYDAGSYETYMIGRTRVAGITPTLDLDVSDDLKLVVEAGVGSKMDVQQWRMYPYTSWQPYPGKAQQGTTLLAHGHIGAIFSNMLTATLHLMYTWTADDARTSLNGQKTVSGVNPEDNVWGTADRGGTSAANARDGSMRIIGLDLKLDGGWMGDGYVGFSSIKAKNAHVLQDTIEVLHSQGGGQFANNYLGDKGDGTVNSFGFQYTFSLAAFMMRPQAWWGQGADFTAQVFGIYTWITGIGEVLPSTYFAGITGPDGQGAKKLKVGTTLTYTPLPTVSFALRVDRVQPNMSNDTHTFNVFSPRIILRTEFVTHEMITFQYQYYNYGSWYNKQFNGESGSGGKMPDGMPFPGLPYPYGQAGNLYNPGQIDKHTFTIAASMWW